MQVLFDQAAPPCLMIVVLAELAPNCILHERQGACLRVAPVAAIVGAAAVGQLVVSYVPPGDLREALWQVGKEVGKSRSTRGLRL